MKPTVNKEICIGCGSCTSLCPEVFELGDDMKSYLKKGAELDKNEKCIKEAVDTCPVQAISME